VLFYQQSGSRTSRDTSTLKSDLSVYFIMQLDSLFTSIAFYQFKDAI